MKFSRVFSEPQRVLVPNRILLDPFDDLHGPKHGVDYESEVTFWATLTKSVQKIQKAWWIEVRQGNGAGFLFCLSVHVFGRMRKRFHAGEYILSFSSS